MELYPDRPTGIDNDTKVQYSPSPEEQLLVNEADDYLSKLLEPVLNIDIKTFTLFGIEYFLTDEGYMLLHSIYKEATKNGLLEFASFRKTRTENLQWVISVLDRIDFSQFSKQRRDEIAGIISKAAEQRLQKSFSPLLADSNFNTEGIEAPMKYNVVLEPDKAIDKVAKLREIKRTLMQERTKYKNQKAVYTLYSAYIQKMNVNITSLISDLVHISDKYNRRGADFDKTKALKEQIPYGTSFKGFGRNRNLARLDRYLHGKGLIRENGDYTPIGKSARETGEKLSDQQGIILPDMDTYTTEAYGENFPVDAEMLKEMFEEVLRANGLLRSEENPNGWTVYLSSKARNLSVNTESLAHNPSGKRINIPVDFVRAFYGIKPNPSVMATIAHEMTHIFRREVMKVIKLQLYSDRISPPRGSVVSEGAAVRAETQVQTEVFNLPREINGDYLAAAMRRLEGGNFLECVKAFYDSYIHHFPQEDRKEALKLAISRTRRIFRHTQNLESHDPEVTQSEPLYYLEQSLITLIDPYGVISPYLLPLIQNGVISINSILSVANKFQLISEILTPDVIRRIKEMKK